MEKKIKIALVSSFTADLLPQLISKKLEDFEIHLDWYIAPFDQMSSEVKLVDSPCRKFAPAIILLLFLPEDFLNRKESTLSLIRQYSQNFPKATILVTNAYFLQPQQLNFYKINNPKSVYYQIDAINQELVKVIMKLDNVHLLNFSNLQSQFDPRLYYLAKIPFSREGLEKIASLLTASIQAVLGKRKKCLVLDLDNVLWGGTLAEDGAEHLKLDVDGEGKAFYDFQNLILELYHSGIILAICSKNDKQLALKAIKKLPYMILREDKFAAIRINWLDKAQNIKSIAQELNLGLDSFVFLDDTPFERSAVKKLLPEVVVPEMPKDFSFYPSFLAKLPFFDSLSLSEEDTKRGELYLQERKRNELKANAVSFEDFLRSLNIEVIIKKVDKWSLPRVAQLTQKTNQFNLSLNRYQEVDILRMLKNTKTSVLSLSTKDDLGDAGIVGAVILKLDKKEAFLDTFLMSCRVLGRGIEEAFMHEIANLVKKSGAEKIKARYNPTDKNLMVKTFLKKAGFTELNGYFWLDLKRIPTPPGWIKIKNK